MADANGFVPVASITAEHQDGWLCLSFWDRSHQKAVAKVKVDAAEVLQSLGQLVGQATYALEDAITQVARGECNECMNRRLVVVQKHGKPWTERCPNCEAGKVMSRTAETVLDDRPRIVPRG